MVSGSHQAFVRKPDRSWLYGNRTTEDPLERSDLVWHLNGVLGADVESAHAPRQVEKLMPGTPHEMISTYNDENGGLVMTHYCMLHNQPKLKLVSADDKQIQETRISSVTFGLKLEDSLFQSPDAQAANP